MFIVHFHFLLSLLTSLYLSLSLLHFHKSVMVRLYYFVLWSYVRAAGRGFGCGGGCGGCCGRRGATTVRSADLTQIRLAHLGCFLLLLR